MIPIGYNGNGVEQNREEAVKWYTLAAEAGHAAAQYNLAFCYRYGMGIAQDYEEAAKWFRLAAAQGDSAAEEALKEMARKGLIDAA